MRFEPDIIGISKILRKMETGGFLITERQHLPNSVYGSHAHESTVIGIVYQGSFTEIINKHSEECIPYSLQLLPVGEYHTYKFNNSDVRCLTIEIKPHRLDEINCFSKILNQPIFFREGISLPVKRLYKEFQLGDNTSILTIEGLILEI